MTRPRTFLGGSWLQWLAAWAAVATLVTLVAINPPGNEPSPRLSCMSNISQLAHGYRRAVETKRFDPALHGSAQVLSWLGGDGLKLGQERVFFCPGDGDVELPETDDARRAFHPADATALRAARGLGSYAVRDFERFPIDPNGTERQPILCDRHGANGRTMHHRGLIVVAFDDGEAQTFNSEDLGVPTGDPIVVGPDSPCEMLRVFEKP